MITWLRRANHCLEMPSGGQMTQVIIVSRVGEATIGDAIFCRTPNSALH
jgi:hypothetical protein